MTFKYITLLENNLSYYKVHHKSCSAVKIKLIQLVLTLRESTVTGRKLISLFIIWNKTTTISKDENIKMAATSIKKYSTKDSCREYGSKDGRRPNLKDNTYRFLVETTDCRILIAYYLLTSETYLVSLSFFLIKRKPDSSCKHVVCLLKKFKNCAGHRL